MSKLKKRIFLNTIASAFQKSVKIGEQLVLIPFFIKFWGAEYYGEWLTITTIPTFLAFSDLGFGTSTANTFILSYSSGKRLEAANILKTGLRLMSLMTLALIIISFGILFLIERTSVLNDINIPADEAVSAIFLLLVSRVVYFYYGVFDSFFRVSNKAHVSINFRSVVSFVNIAVAIVILILGGKVVALALGSLVINLVAVPIYMFWANRILDLEERKLAVYSNSTAKILFRKGVGYLLSPMWQAFFFQGTTFVVRIVLGASAVTLFNTMRTLVRSSAQAFGMVVNSILPELHVQYAAGKLKLAKKLYISIILINVSLAVLFFIFLAFFGMPLYEFWTKGVLSLDYSVWMIFILSLPFYVIWFSFSTIFEVVNRPYDLAVPSLILATINIFLCYLLGLEFGLLGSSVAMLFFDFFMCVFVVYNSRKYLSFSKDDLVFFIKGVFSKIQSGTH